MAQWVSGVVIDRKWSVRHEARMVLPGKGKGSLVYWVEIRAAGKERWLLVCGCQISDGDWRRCQGHQRAVVVHVGGRLN